MATRHPSMPAALDTAPRTPPGASLSLVAYRSICYGFFMSKRLPLRGQAVKGPARLFLRTSSPTCMFASIDLTYRPLALL